MSNRRRSASLELGAGGERADMPQGSHSELEPCLDDARLIHDHQPAGHLRSSRVLLEGCSGASGIVKDSTRTCTTRTPVSIDIGRADSGGTETYLGGTTESRRSIPMLGDLCGWRMQCPRWSLSLELAVEEGVQT